jgi:hypothetical protein
MATDPHHVLLRNLARELFQTEMSAVRHCRREARRIPGTPPAVALLATAAHAETALSEIRALFPKHDLPSSTLGMLLGASFSEIRERAADHLLDEERSYRATLLGMRHGVDVVRMFGAVAEQGRQPELMTWTEGWLARREPLVREATEQLRWFAMHVQRALARAH